MKFFRIILLCTILLCISFMYVISFASDNDKSESKSKNKIANAKILFKEDFEDNDFASRGWYDALRGALTSEEHIEGSASCLECKFLKGEKGCEGGTPGRHLFEETDEVYLSYYVKYSENYTGSDKPYHPHEFHFLTNKNHKYVGPAYTHLTLYIEHSEGEPLLAIQDGENIDEDNIGSDLTDITEERAVAGCNGDSDGHGAGDCYLSGNLHRNGKQWRTGDKYFSDEAGKYYKNDWHLIEAYFKLNSIVDGKGIADGAVQYWYDGELLIDYDDVMYRTGEHPDMKFNQFLIAPYIGDGSPVEQTMWIDDLTVATSRIKTDSAVEKEAWKTYPYHQDGSVLNFPDDEGWHPSENTEWWYTVAHVRGDSSGKDYSYMLSYFYYPQYGFDGFRIFNLADDSSGEFYTEMKPCNYINMAEDHLNIKASVFGSGTEEWTTLTENTNDLIPFQYHLNANSDNGSIDMNYNALKRPLMVGGAGFLHQGNAGYSYYYSQTKLNVKGNITLNGYSESVSGAAWIDRQWGEINPSEGEKYEWFCVQLSNDMDLIFYNIFTDNRKIPDTATYRMCSIYVNDSTDISTSDFELTRQKYNYMPDSVNCYSQKWNFKYEDIDLIITTIHNNSEVLLPFRFFEGSTRIEGTVKGVPVSGVGFAELLHTYEEPQLEIISPADGQEWNFSLPLRWNLLNPDDGMPVYYKLEYSSDNKKTFNRIAENITETNYIWNAQGLEIGAECHLRITGYSVDGSLSASIENEQAFTISPTGINDLKEASMNMEIHPNPFSDKATINYILKKPAIVNMRITDLFGREVQKLIDMEYIDSGKHSIEYDSSELIAGVYFCILRAGEYFHTIKLIRL